MQEQAPRLSGQTFGNEWMFCALIWLLKKLPIGVFYYFMYICVIPVTLIFSPGARLTFRYFHEKRGYVKWKSFYSTYKNHCIFGETIIDKFAMYAGHKFDVKIHGLDKYIELTRKSEAIIQLSSHVGCSEVLGYCQPIDKKFNVLVYGGEKSSLMKYRKTSFANSHIRMIPVGGTQSHSDQISDALDNGEIIIAFADRFFNNKKIIVSSLHSHNIGIAKGPVSLAVTRGLDVIMVNSMKESDGSYTAFITPLNYDKSLMKKEQMKQLADAYTAELERLLELYPLQWFNYFNPWQN